MEPQVKRAARPERASSQSKTTGRLALKVTYPKLPKIKMAMVE
jgi:hypothetical protein